MNSTFPDVLPGDTVYVNTSAAGTSDTSWRPAQVTHVAHDSIQCVVLVHDDPMCKFLPLGNVRWHQDPKLRDPSFINTMSNDDSAGVFRLSDRAIRTTQTLDALTAAMEALVIDPKSAKQQVQAVLETVKAVAADRPEPETPAPTTDWKQSRLKSDGKQTAEDKAKVLAAAE